jgi:restriction system protein
VAPAALPGALTGALGAAPAVPPVEAVGRAAAAAEAALAQALLARLRAMPPAFLESAVLRLLVAMGYGRAAAPPAQLAGTYGDGGVDGIVEADELGLERLCVQAKRYGEGKRVGVGAVRDFYGALERMKAAKGVIATTSSFSPEAERTAASLARPIALLDGPALAQLMIRHGVGCTVAASYRVMALDAGFFVERAA